jgi:AraC-like DNA-binding protein
MNRNRPGMFTVRMSLLFNTACARRFYICNPATLLYVNPLISNTFAPMNIAYLEAQPSPVLQPYVDCYWLQSFTETQGEYSPVQRCVPLGMVELIVHLDEDCCEVCFDNRWHRLPRIFMAGLYCDSVVWRSPGNSRKFGIRLNPEAMHLFFNLAAAELYSDYSDVANIGLNHTLEYSEQLAGVTSFNQAIRQTEAYLVSRLQKVKAQDSYLVEAARMMRSAKGDITIEELSRAVSVSPRQLQRSFRDQLGTSPKTYSRLIRFRNAYLQMHKLEEAGGWAGISYASGYADQAHFIREFKEFTGQIPNVMLNNAGQVWGKVVQESISHL